MLTDVVLQFEWTVDLVDAAGNATITQELKRFSVSIGDPAVPTQAIEYASDIAPAELPSAMRKLQRKAKPLIGLKCVLEMTSSGQITSVRIDAESQKKLAKLEKAPNLQALFSKESLEKIANDLSLTAISADADTAGWFKKETRDSGLGEVTVEHVFSVGPSETVKGRKLVSVDVVSSLLSSAYDTTENGIEIADITVGDGADLTEGSTYNVHYIVWDADTGDILDSSFWRAETLPYTVGENRITGWEEGMAGMKVGGNRQMRIPAEVTANPQITGTLIFEVEVVEEATP